MLKSEFGFDETAPEGPQRVEDEVVGGNFRVEDESDEEADEGQKVVPDMRI